MAIITGKTLQGNCGAVRCPEPGHYVCFPVPDQPGKNPHGVDYLLFYAKLMGKAGEEICLDIKYPEFDEAVAGWRKYKTQPFFPLAPHCTYLSADEVNWTRLTNVEVERENWLVRLRFVMPADVCYVSVNYYYTMAMYRQLQKDLAQTGARAIEIGNSRDGQPLTVWSVTDPDAALEEKTLIYYQGGQHCCEFGGMHLADAMLRYLTGGSPEANALLKKYEFHILPVVSMADWTEGLVDELDADSNTVWDTLSTPETRAVDAYLRSLPKKPAVLIDAHNTRTKNHLILSAYPAPELVEQQRQLAEIIAENCDYMEKGAPKWAESEIYHNFKQYALQNYGCAVTMEIARCGLYNREAGKNLPHSRERFETFGRQLCHAIDLFLSNL